MREPTWNEREACEWARRQEICSGDCCSCAWCIDEDEEKTCGRCIHDEESENIVGSPCYLCKRNPTDNRIDWFEKKKEEKNDI